MSPPITLPELLKGLAEKTRQQKAVWKEPNADVFVLSLQNAHVVLALESPPTRADHFTLSIGNREGKTVTAWEIEEDTEEWALADELFREIQKQVRGWYKVAEEIATFLKS